MYARALRALAAATAIFCVQCMSVSVAWSTPITYTFTGTASGDLNGTPFTNATFTASGSGGTSGVGLGGTGHFNALGTGTIVIGGVGTVTTDANILVFTNSLSSVWGFSTGTGDWLDVTNPTAATYGLDQTLAPSTGTQFLAGHIATSGGTLTLTSVPLTFQATLNPVQSNPVPALGPFSLVALTLLIVAGLLAMRARRPADRA